jgi:hypothetical protein
MGVRRMPCGQVFSTNYGAGSEGQGWFWVLVGGAMLWLVAKRHSGLARAFIVVTSLFGAATFIAADPTGVHAWTHAALYLGQALPLLTPTVRAHVHSAPAVSPRLQVAAA